MRSSRSFITRVRFAARRSPGSMASSRFALVIHCWFRRAVMSRAASFKTLARSAPVKPGSVSRRFPDRRRDPSACWPRAPADLQVALHVGRLDGNLAVEPGRGRTKAGSSTSGRLVAAINTTPPRTSKRSINQQLVQGLLALVVSAAHGAAMTADRVDFVNEDDRGVRLLGLSEQVADAARAPRRPTFRRSPDWQMERGCCRPASAQQCLARARRARTPLGIFAPTAWNLAGSERNSRDPLGILSMAFFGAS